ncbi:MAG: eukaryotic-like serine/threonine-protein kinase [Chthoniobacter sp.]|jgi:formylglycine-generating enzyme required for sulfatase activity|nr:eukaryotic-like serine/threonine-protein kinase [Chthoniobacter sp.]
MPVITDRKTPNVPNHQMVRIIGRGAYGEIWLARSLTGTWRAVKIVDRRTFESEKAFHREFEGMAKFEPFSREDPGFVDILHVGRDEGGDFFYYVMELADDHVAGERIDPDQYVPKTLKTELGRRSRLLVDECITIGLSLTSALAALHRQGLVHRDIKPANIIFVGGVPKIADIGLVAASGQDSFVGTEGYVPPEGPGSVQADIYSLGKVLYELAMGKDRLDFPAINTRLGDLPDKTGLLQFNEVLLRACANEPAERYVTAAEMHEDLVRVRDGRPLKRRWKIPWAGLALLVAVAVAAGGIYAGFLRSAHGDALVETDPPGAMVVCRGSMRRSPARFQQLGVGACSAHVMLTGYEPVDLQFEIASRRETRLATVRLQRSHGAAQLDSRPAGAVFELRDGETLVKSGRLPASLADLPTGPYQLVTRLDGREQHESLEIKRGELTEKIVEFATGGIVVTSEPPGAEIIVDGVRAGVAPLDLTLAEGPHEVVAKYRQWPELRRAVVVRPATPAETAFEFIGGSVKITSAPGGATVVMDGRELDARTPLLLEGIDPGEVRYELRLAGFKPLEVSGTVTPGQQTFLGARFVQRIGPQRGENWENSLGMKFVPVEEVLMAVWPTRVQDYDAFCTATSRARPVADFPQDGTHPVVKVNWEDATAFCEWLTKKELATGQLEDGQRYRLPADLEWSVGVGLLDEGRDTPEQRDGKPSDFPWGKIWPPPERAGNYADTSLRRGNVTTIPGYHDSFPQTSPVGSFGVNKLGLADMGGNVWQWCLDSYKGGAHTRDWGVLRGGSWATAKPAEMRSSYRNVVDRGERDVIYGFRCVLVPDSGR